MHEPNCLAIAHHVFVQENLLIWRIHVNSCIISYDIQISICDFKFSYPATFMTNFESSRYPNISLEGILITCFHISVSMCPLLPNFYRVVKSTNATVIGTEVTFTCEAGYQLIVSNPHPSKTCTVNGLWVGQNPVCERKYMLKRFLYHW